MKSNYSTKPVYCDSLIFKKVYLFKKSFVFKFAEKFIYNRSNCVPKAYIGLNVFIYNGKKWHVRAINKWMVGFKFGEFTWNRKIALYKAKQLKKKN